MRTRLQGFALGAGLTLLPLLALWWLSVDWIGEAGRPFASWLSHQLMPIEAIVPAVRGGWLVRTSVEVVAGKVTAGAEIATFEIAIGNLRRLTLAWPLFLALILAPPRPPDLLARILAGLLTLAVLSVLSACAVVFLHLAVLVNHMPAGDAEPLPSIHVAWPAYSNATFFVSQFARYVAVYILPLLAPSVLWLALNPTARALFLGFGGAPRAPPVRSSKAGRGR